VLCLVRQRSLLSQFLQFWGAQLLLLAPALLTAMGGVPILRRQLGGSLRRARAEAVIASPESAGWDLTLLLGGGLVAVLLADRLGSGVLALCLLLALIGGLGARRALQPDARIGGRPLAFALGAVCLGALLLAACEVIYIRDFYGGALRRMNTVFKFYYQAWLLIAVGGGAATFWLLRRLLQRRSEQGGLLALGACSLTGVLLLLATLMFPYKAALLRTDNFRAAATLDGMDWMRRYHPDDHAAAQWLLQHAADGGMGEPVILEAVGGPYSEFARMATQTGYPTVLGWDQHESLWRGPSIGAELEARKRDVEAIYRAGAFPQAEPLLRKYRVSHIVAGYLEAQKYGGASPDEQRQFFSRFDTMAATGGLKAVFKQGQAAIYRVPSSP
jgi:uncharacterized membrane protein